MPEIVAEARSTEEDHRRRIRLGMIGGGRGAFIGAIHRIAARLDDQYEIVAGVLSSDPTSARQSADDLHIAPDRQYETVAEMLAAERGRSDRMDVVAIVTPNDSHFSAAQAALQSGYHVICEKPMTTEIEQARELCALVAKAGLIFCVTYNYTGYPMVRQARSMVAEGLLGQIRVVQVEYAQSWLSLPLEASGHKQASWRTNPARAGRGGAIGDIGTHAINLASFVTGLEVLQVSADLSAFVPGRTLDDNANVLLRFAHGAKGMLWVSQVAAGHDNDLKLRLYGSQGGLEWSQESPNELWFSPLSETRRLIVRGGVSVGPDAARASRLPSGHPEGYLESFATIYSEVARAIRAKLNRQPHDAQIVYPGVDDGFRGVQFVEAVVRSSAQDGLWTDV